MIRAVVLLAEWDHDNDNYRITHQDEPPPATPAMLAEWWDFRRYGLPPNAGGMRDQPLGWMHNCQQLAEAYRVWLAWMTCDKGPDWRRAHPGETRTALQLRGMVYG